VRGFPTPDLRREIENNPEWILIDIRMQVE